MKEEAEAQGGVLVSGFQLSAFQPFSFPAQSPLPQTLEIRRQRSEVSGQPQQLQLPLDAEVPPPRRRPWARCTLSFSTRFPITNNR